MKIYVDIDWRKIPTPLPLKTTDVVRFCDLRNCSLEGLDLSEVEFLGCRLNGTSFQCAELGGTRFIGCFSSDDYAATDFRHCVLDGSSLVDSHLNCLIDSGPTHLGQWPDEIARIASETLSPRNDVRYEAALAAGRYGDPRIAPIIACLLSDEEWDVRSAALEALGALYRSVTREQAQSIAERIVMRSGDVHSLVRSKATALSKELSAPENMLRNSVGRMSSSSHVEQLAGLRSAMALLTVDEKNQQLVDLQVLDRLRRSDSEEVRSESLHLLGILDNPSNPSWLLDGLSDSEPSVRIAALQAIALLTAPPSADHLRALLHDRDEQVRIEALLTIKRLEGLSQTDLSTALNDPSPEMRRIARKMATGE